MLVQCLVLQEKKCVCTPKIWCWIILFLIKICKLGVSRYHRQHHVVASPSDRGLTPQPSTTLGPTIMAWKWKSTNAKMQQPNNRTHWLKQMCWMVVFQTWSGICRSHNKFDLRATRFQDVLDKAEKDGVGKVSIAGEWDSKTQIRILPWSEHAKFLLKPMSKNNAGILNNDAPYAQRPTTQHKWQI